MSSSLCAPGDRQEPQFLLRFEDTDIDDMWFTDEVEARKKWEEFCGPNGQWNGYLFGLVARPNSPTAALGESPTKAVSHD